MDSRSRTGLAAFTKAHDPERRLLVGGDGIPVEEFLLEPPDRWMAEKAGTN